MHKSLACLITAAVFATAGATAMAQDSAGTAPVKVFDAGELTPSRYTVIERIWTGTWGASFWLPSHDDAAAAVAALTDKAARLRADGVVNLHCLNDRGWSNGYYCYGLAIKLK